MALPINNSPIYKLKVPSTGTDINYRPFLIKEEKMLLIAQQSEDPMVMVESLKNVIASCVKSDIDVNTLATFDLEYIFTQIRAKSVGEHVDLTLRCDTCADEKATANVTIDLTKIEVEKPKEHTNKISLYDDVGIIMKYPTFDILKKLESVDVSDLDEVFDVVAKCVDSIYTTDEIFHANEQSPEELMEFLNNLSSEQFAKVQKFFETMPRIKYDIEYDCPICKKHHVKSLEGLNNFF
jgi:ribosomal protein L44E